MCCKSGHLTLAEDFGSFVILCEVRCGTENVVMLEILLLIGDLGIIVVGATGVGMSLGMTLLEEKVEGKFEEEHESVETDKRNFWKLSRSLSICVAVVATAGRVSVLDGVGDSSLIVVDSNGGGLTGTGFLLGTGSAEINDNLGGRVASLGINCAGACAALGALTASWSNNRCLRAEVSTWRSS